MRLNFSGQKTSQNLDAHSAISHIEKMGLKYTKRPTPIAKDEEIRYLDDKQDTTYRQNK